MFNIDQYFKELRSSPGIPFQKKEPFYEAFSHRLLFNRLYLVTGGPGAGKTSFIIQKYIVEPLLYLIKSKTLDRVKIVFYSLEVNREEVGIKICSTLLHYTKNIRYKYMDILTDISIQEEFQKLDKRLNKLLKNTLYVNDDIINADDIIKDLYENHLSDLGDRQLIVLLDNLFEVDFSGQHGETHSSIDKFVGHFVTLRKTLKSQFCGVLLQHLKEEVIDMKRPSAASIIPSLNALGDSKKTARKVDVCYALISPMAYNKSGLINNFEGYPLNDPEDISYGDNLKVIAVLKNRYGRQRIWGAFYFQPESNYFVQLPPALDLFTLPQHNTLLQKINNWSKEY